MKRSKMKKLFAIIMVACLSVSMFGMSVSAAREFANDWVEYEDGTLFYARTCVDSETNFLGISMVGRSQSLTRRIVSGSVLGNNITERRVQLDTRDTQTASKVAALSGTTSQAALSFHAYQSNKINVFVNLDAWYADGSHIAKFVSFVNW